MISVIAQIAMGPIGTALLTGHFRPTDAEERAALHEAIYGNGIVVGLSAVGSSASLGFWSGGAAAKDPTFRTSKNFANVGVIALALAFGGEGIVASKLSAVALKSAAASGIVNVLLGQGMSLISSHRFASAASSWDDFSSGVVLSGPLNKILQRIVKPGKLFILGGETLPVTSWATKFNRPTALTRTLLGGTHTYKGKGNIFLKLIKNPVKILNPKNSEEWFIKPFDTPYEIPNPEDYLLATGRSSLLSGKALFGFQFTTKEFQAGESHWNAIGRGVSQTIAVRIIIEVHKYL